MKAIKWINRLEDNSIQEIVVDLDNLESKNTYQLVDILRQINMIDMKEVGIIVDENNNALNPNSESFAQYWLTKLNDIENRNQVQAWDSENMMSGYRFRKFGIINVGKNRWAESRHYLSHIVNAWTGEVDKKMLGQWGYTKHDWGQWIWGLEVNLNKRKNGKGWTIHCSVSMTYYNNYDSISDEKSRDYDSLYVKLADALETAGIKTKHRKTCTTFFKPMKEMIFVNETKVGVRCLTTKVDKNGFKPLWGQSLYRQLKIKFLQGELQSSVNDAYRYLEKAYKKTDVLPICENLSFGAIFPDDYRYLNNWMEAIQLHGITQDNLRYLSGAKNIHQALNNAFGTPVDKMGKEESRYIFLEIPIKENSGITRKAFGGQQEFKHWHQLCSAIQMVRMFKAFGPSFFEQMKIDFVLPPVVIHKVERLGGDQNYVIYPTRSGGGRMNYQDVQNMQKYLKIFGATTAYKNQILRTFTWDEADRKSLEALIDPNDRQSYGRVYVSERQNAIYHLLNQVTDALSSLKKIPVGNRRKAVVEQVKRQKYDFDQTHDYVVQEAMKYTHEAKKTSNTRLINSFDGKEIIDGVIFRAPKTTHDLYLWGTQQNNCIGTSWADAVAARHQFIVGFEDVNTGKWIGHARFIILDSGKQLEIQEFRGKGQELQEDLRNKLVKWMKSNLVKEEN